LAQSGEWNATAILSPAPTLSRRLPRPDTDEPSHPAQRTAQRPAFQYSHSAVCESGFAETFLSRAGVDAIQREAVRSWPGVIPALLQEAAKLKPVNKDELPIFEHPTASY